MNPNIREEELLNIPKVTVLFDLLHYNTEISEHSHPNNDTSTHSRYTNIKAYWPVDRGIMHNTLAQSKETSVPSSWRVRKAFLVPVRAAISRSSLSYPYHRSLSQLGSNRTTLVPFPSEHYSLHQPKPSVHVLHLPTLGLHISSSRRLTT